MPIQTAPPPGFPPLPGSPPPDPPQPCAVPAKHGKDKPKRKGDL